MRVLILGPVMKDFSPRFIAFVLLFALTVVDLGCSAAASNQPFFGKSDPPADNVLRYISGSEPEALDPQVSDGQPEARIAMALYEGLVEYDPKTTAPIPALAERWETNNDTSEFTFHLRRQGRFSNGEAITARDFVYTIRRGMSPEFASRNAGLAYYIKYAQAYNEKDVFVQDPQSGRFVVEQDVADAPAGIKPPLTSQPVASVSEEYPPITEDKTPDADTEFHRFMHSPPRLVLPSDEKKRAKQIEANPKLKALIAGKKFVPVEAKDIGVEAVDDYTLRICLGQPAPFFLSMLAHPFFRALNQRAIEKFGPAWTDPRNIVTSGPFKVAVHRPYDRIVTVRDPMYWDAASVKLDGI